MSHSGRIGLALRNVRLHRRLFRAHCPDRPALGGRSSEALRRHRARRVLDHRGARRQGHDVTLFASGDSETSAKLAPCAPGALRLLGYRDHTASHLAMLQQVRRRAHEFDILHFHIDLLQFPLFEDLDAQVPHDDARAARRSGLHAGLRDLHGHAAGLDLGQPAGADAAAVNWLATVHHGLPARTARSIRRPGGYLAFLGRISPEKRPGPRDRDRHARRACR